MTLQFNAIRRFLPVLALALAFAVLAAGPARAGPVTIVALGDSLTAGYGLPEADAFPVRLERTLKERGHDVVIVNAGVSGDTTAGGLARLDWVLADRPAIVILALGANDGLRGIDPRTTRANLDAILDRLGKERVRTLLLGMYAPPNLGRTYGDAFNAIFPDLAARHGAALMPFMLQDVATIASLNQADGIHPNRAGVDIMVRNVLPHVEALLPAK
jgi:acyl-CoA thioesterase-1